MPDLTTDDGAGDRYRLPSGVRPLAYRLTLAPDLDRQAFTGSVEIDVVVDEPTPEILVNAVDLEVRRAEVVTPDGRFDAEVRPLEDVERIALRCETALVGPLTVELEFAGVLNDRLAGFYRSSFTDDAGDSHPIATTQLCVTDARRAFPCFDEPAFKATYELTAIVPPGNSAFSNASVAREATLNDASRSVTFRPTIPLSTYLVALTVGPFVQTDAVEVDGIALSVVCTPGRERLAEFALEVGAFALRFYADYFGIEYPGDKIDLVGIPDFAYGAMENFGCITFRESALLVDRSNASIEELERVALVVAHELAHMWFGDLVTMRWWEGIWLNEAFATHLSYVCVDAFRPSWRMWLRFHEAREDGLEVDALRSTRPIELEVRSPGDAMAMLDVITYEKGASVLRMLEEYLGEHVYRDGIRRYLSAHAYANTVTSDLWRALEEASGVPVGAVMDSWILQPGHPVVDVQRGVASQRRFRFGGPAEPADEQTWQIPVRATSIGGDAVTSIVGPEPRDLGVGATCVANAGWGFYRTRYDPDGFAELAARLHSLTELQRGVLLSDTWALAQAGLADVGDVLDLARGLGPVPEPSSWRTIEAALTTLSRLVDDPQRAAYERLVRELTGPLLDQLGIEPAEGEDGAATFVRSLAVRVLGSLGNDAAVREHAAARFDAGKLTGDLAAAFVLVVAAMGRPGDREAMFERMDAAPTPQDAVRYRDGIAAYADEAGGLDTLRSCFERFRLPEVFLLVPRLVANPIAGKAVWTAMSEDWESFVTRIPAPMQFSLAAGVTGFVDDPAFAERVTTFHRTHPLEVGQQRVEQFLERLENGVAFARLAQPSLAAVLA